MINANDNSRMMGLIVEEIAKQYHWASYKPTTPAKRIATTVTTKNLTAYEGRYELYNNRMITFAASKDRLFTLTDGFEDEEFVPETPTRFASADRDAYITFSPNAKGEVTELVWKNGKEERKIPRIGPLFHVPKPVADPDPARTRMIEAALLAMAKGGKAVEETLGITQGARKDFAQGAGVLSDLKSITFINAEDVNGRGIERHEGKVEQVLNYKFGPTNAPHYVLVYLTADGLVTDYDVVEK